MNLDGLNTRTCCTFDPVLKNDTLILNGKIVAGMPLRRVSLFLEHFRKLAGNSSYARVESENNFPTGTGIASSASAFAALTLAASRALNLQLSEHELSRMARLGSGSACRSIPAGFVEWRTGKTDKESYAETIAPPDYWNLVDCIAILSTDHKEKGSTEGHLLAASSPLQAARVKDAPRRLDICRKAILEKDFSTFSKIVELDSNLMHAVMMTSNPPLLYWLPPTLEIMHAVETWRREGLSCCYTIDAGPNVHILCPQDQSIDLTDRLRQLKSVQYVLTARPGGCAQPLE
jgi:diphosphomevalonate decarboxylase